jgi:general secretion pathway protein G
MYKPLKVRKGFTLIELMIVIAILAILLLALLPNYVRAKSRSRLNGCEANLRTMATACEMYAYDNNRNYSPLLTSLTPNYLRSIQKCPSAGDNTNYISGYTTASNPDAYTLTCKGSFHVDLNLAADRPVFTSDRGLQE